MRAHLPFLVLLGACTHVRPEAQTAENHREDAEVHQRLATQELARADAAPAPTAKPLALPNARLTVGEQLYESYRPRDEHLAAADREFRLASEHLAAAKALDTFADQACAGLTNAQRAACPLFASSVSLVETTPRGFKLTFWPRVDVNETYHQLSCHLAWAVASGFARPSCPLFVRGTTLERFGERGVEFKGESAEVAERLRAEARRLFLGVERTGL
jgi:hypothetical protein